jgi:hypothetical protein
VNDRPRLGVWLYQRTAPEAFQPIAIKTWDQWINGRAPLPPCDDGFVWYVFMQVWTLNRRVVRVDNLQFLKSRVNAAGFQEDEMRLEEMAVAVNSLSERRASAMEGPVIDASNRFAKRRYRWKPTTADLRALERIVNKRAGWQVLK